MFSHQYQGNRPQARSLPRPTSSFSTNKVGPYTRLNMHEPRERPVNAKDSEEMDNEVDYSFSHMSVRDRKKLFQAGAGGGQRSSMTMPRGRTGRSAGPYRPPETQSDIFEEVHAAPAWAAPPASAVIPVRSQPESVLHIQPPAPPFRSSPFDTADRKLTNIERHGTGLSGSTSRYNMTEGQASAILHVGPPKVSPVRSISRPSFNKCSTTVHLNEPTYNRHVSGPGTRVIPAKRDGPHQHSPTMSHSNYGDSHSPVYPAYPANANYRSHTNYHDTSNYSATWHVTDNYGRPKMEEHSAPQSRSMSSSQYPAQSVHIPAAGRTQSYHAPVDRPSTRMQPPPAMQHYNRQTRSPSCTSTTTQIHPNPYPHGSFSHQPKQVKVYSSSPAMPRGVCAISTPVNADRDKTPIPVKSTLQPSNTWHGSRRQAPVSPGPRGVGEGAYFDEEAGISEF